MNYHQALIAEDANEPLNHWISILVASILFHMAVLFVIKFDLSPTLKTGYIPNSPIIVILQKKPIYPKPVPDSKKEFAQPSVQTKKAHQKDTNPLQSLTNSKADKTRTTKEKIENKDTTTPSQPKIIANIVNNNETKRDLAIAWEATAKEVIRENVENETLRNQRQEELWLKSPSDMYGKPRDYFDRQDKKAMLADTHESNIPH